jgi:hypothetical protein
MPFNLVNGRLAGGFASGGSWFGGKDRVVIAAGMVLMPAQSPTSQPASP